MTAPRHAATSCGWSTDDIDDALERLQKTRSELRALRDRARQLDPADCAAEDVCSAVLTGR